ncbi:MAG: hypothetical protein DDT27_01527 [Dehalococcoidia bacterium]|nr:hypothetical protein [Chloroflexota bacterium]
MGAIAAAGGEERRIDVEDFNWDARYWWGVPPLTACEREQVREIMTLIFDRYFGIDISRMSPQEFEDVGTSIGLEGEKKALRLFEHYARERGFQMPAGIFEMPIPREREEFIPPKDATYWWEFIDPELREQAIAQAKIEIPKMLRSYWECADWKGIELPLPRPDVDVMKLPPEEYHLILSPPSFPLGRRGVEEWIERVLPGANIIAVFGRTRTYSNPSGWFDRLHEANNLFPLLVGRFGVSAMGIIGAGYIQVWLDCGKLTVEEAEAVAPKIYAMLAAKAEMVGIEDIPVVFVLEALKATTADLYIGTAKDPRDHLGTCLPLDQNFRPVPGGAQRSMGGGMATIGFPVRDPIPFWWDDEDLTTTGHIGDTIAPVNTRVYQPLPPHLVGTVADVASWGGRADVARVATPDGDVIPYVRTMTFHTAPVTGSRDPVVNEWSGKFGGTTGRTSGRIYATGVQMHNPAFGILQKQVVATIRIEPGDSGAPLFISGPDGGVAVTGIAWGFCRVRPERGLFSPVSGVMHELPGWYPYTR